MSRHDNNVNRKLRTALHRMRLLRSEQWYETPPTNGPAVSLPPVDNYFARFGNGHVRMAVHGRPSSDVVAMAAQRRAVIKDARRADRRHAAYIARHHSTQPIGFLGMFRVITSFLTSVPRGLAARLPMRRIVLFGQY
jgi:hypothetical protein